MNRLETLRTRKCEHCINFETEGGDWVPTPFGLGQTQLPVYEFCNAPLIEGLTDEQHEKIINKYLEGDGNCPYFQQIKKEINEDGWIKLY